MLAPPSGNPEDYTDEQRLSELARCSIDPSYFINNYIYILDRRLGQWTKFSLYPKQEEVVAALQIHRQIIALKSRQVGFTTLIGGADFLWTLLFEKDSFCLILSKSEREAQALLVDRLRPMYDRLPSWMKPRAVEADSKSEFVLSNGSVLRSLPTSAGDSYTCRKVLIDEAALVYRSRTSLQQVLLNVYPTIEAGGQIILNSKADKSRPNSTFNNLFREAMAGKNDFHPIFADWRSVPHRTDEWYAKQVELSKSIDGTLDFVHETYPATWHEALKAKESNRRLSYLDLVKCFAKQEGLLEFIISPPPIPGLTVYKESVGGQFIICVDPAEGNPNSDNSVADVFDWDTGEQVANLCCQAEVTVFAEYIAMLSEYYGNAPVWSERNNHGHAVIALLREKNIRVLEGPDTTKSTPKFGYLSTAKGKAIGYVELAERLTGGEIIIHKQKSFDELSNIQGSNLSAPEGFNDDHATTFMLFAAAKRYVHLKLLVGFV